MFAFVTTSALRRHVSLDRVFYRLYPNTYTVLVAGTATCRKSVAMKIGVTAPGSSTNIFVNALLARDGLAPDYDVYDAAAWSAPLPLTEISVAKGSMPVKFPDFTRGKSHERKASQIAL